MAKMFVGCVIDFVVFLSKAQHLKLRKQLFKLCFSVDLSNTYQRYSIRIAAPS